MLFVGDGDRIARLRLLPDGASALLAELGLRRHVSQITNTSPRNNTIQNVLVNPYAAVPSMHVACAAMLGWTLVLLVRNRLAKPVLGTVAGAASRS